MRIDPFYAATLRHFAHLLRRYGNPVLVLNLIKQAEKRPRESKLNHEFNDAMQFINESLVRRVLGLPPDRLHSLTWRARVAQPADQQIPYLAWDWKAAAKRDLKGMIAHMCSIGERAVDLTGFFCSRPPKYRNEWLMMQRGEAPLRSDQEEQRRESERRRAHAATTLGGDVPPTLYRVAPPKDPPPPCFVQRGVLRTNWFVPPALRQSL